VGTESLARKKIAFLSKIRYPHTLHIEIHPMSQFSNQLQASMEACDFTQTQISEKTGVSQGQLSRYMSGEHRPPTDAFEKLCRPFPDSHGTALLTAYLADDIPQSLSKLVSVTPKIRSAIVEEEPPVYRTRMPKELRAAYDFIGADALKNADTADWVIAVYRRLRSSDA
jgi:transcriptional regulator with XRE-family HTH domain